jgi:hypothetical protein
VSGIYGHHYPDDYIPDPLTDSAAHRFGLGTLVKLHLYGGDSAIVGLLAIRDVSNWDDLVARVERGMVIEVLASRRRLFAAGAIMWAEVLSDPMEENPMGGD